MSDCVKIGKNAVRELFDKLKVMDKKALPLIDQGNNKFAVFAVQSENKRGKGELHEKADDIFMILHGDCVIETGGELVNKQMKAYTEYIGDDLKNSQKHQLSEGDLFTVPRNIPHLLDTTGMKVKCLCIKVY